MVSSKNYLPKSSAHNRSFTSAIARPSRRDFIRTFAAAGFAASFGGALAPQRLEANNGLRSINWKEILARFGDSVVIPGERDASGKDMIVGRTMNEIYQHYSWQQRKWCSEDASHCEGEVAHARRDNRVLVSWDYIISVPILGRGQSATSMRAREFSSIYLPLGIYNKHEHIAREFANYANDILGLSGKYSDLQMVDENGESRSLLLSKQGVPVFFSAEELLFIYAHYRMNKVTQSELARATEVMGYGGNEGNAYRLARRHKRIGNVRAAGMNNLQTALRVMFNHHRFINDSNDQSIDSTAPFENYRTMTDHWSTDFYWKGGRKISAEQSQVRIRAMLAKDPEPLGSVGRDTVLPGLQNLPIPEIKNNQGQIIRGKDIIDIANELYPNEPLKASQLVLNWISRFLLQTFIVENRGFVKREQLQQGNEISNDSPERRFLNFISLPRTFLTEKAVSTTLAQN